MKEILQKALLFTISLLIATLLWLKVNKKELYMHPIFESYRREFIKQAKMYGTTVDFTLTSTSFSTTLPSSVAGRCIGRKIIQINLNMWEHLDDDEREITMFHEWGHCLLNRRHVDSYLDGSSCPASLMFPTVDNTAHCYRFLRFWYMGELFRNPANIPPLYE